MTNPDIELTVNEQAALDEQAAEIEAANAPAPVEAAPTPEPEPAPAAPDPVLSAIADNAAATRALADQLAADRAAAEARAAAAATPEAPPAPRSFDSEFEALQQKFDDGDLDAAEHARELRRLTLEEADARAEARIAAEREAQAKAQQDAAAKAQQEADAKAEADWNAANAEFFKDPGNAALVGDEIKKAAFQAAINVVGREQPGIGYTELLAKARERITGVEPVDASKAIKDATFERQKDAGGAPVTLRDVPSAGHPAGADPGAALDNLDISTLEDTLARMSDADRNRYLAAAPGNEQRSAA